MPRSSFAFVALVAAGSAGPSAPLAGHNDVARACLVIAIAAVVSNIAAT